jgi:stage II sporulation protein D
VGAVKDISVDGRTPSGRVAAIIVETERGQYRVRGNDVRYVLRSAGGELLNSTYFSPEVVSGADGRLARLTLHGLGYGHGVGMCQWGAIGRARAGQDFRTILRTYFPGTSVARAY